MLRVHEQSTWTHTELKDKYLSLFFFGSNPGEFHTCLWGVDDICLSNDQQSVYVVGTHCILPLCLGSVVHLTFIQCIFIFNTHCATDVPALLGCPPPSAVLFMGIFSSTTEITLSLWQSVFIFHLYFVFLLCVYKYVYFFFCSTSGRSPVLQVWNQGHPCLRSPTPQDQVDPLSSGLSQENQVLIL